MTGSVIKLLGLFLLLSTYSLTKIKCNDEDVIIPLAARISPKHVQELKQFVIDVLMKNESNFYNYSIICGGNDFDSRFNKDKSFIDQTIPTKYKEFVYQTFKHPSERSNKCPKWSNNNGDDFSVRSGGMESIKIPENAKIGQKLYTLTATDPEAKPIYYFIRKAESEKENYPGEDLIFEVNSTRFGNSWIGEVFLSRKLDFETKNSYSYLTYAFDGNNLIEKYSNIEIIDVDDEKPVIDTSNKAIYDHKMKRFHFRICENLSINDIINPSSNYTNIKIDDVDTKTSQLRLYLTYADSGFGDTPFSINNKGEIKVINNLDYETLKEYVIKLSVKDTADNEADAFIFIELINMPDLPPKFTKPFEDDERITHYLSFYENKLGKVFDLEAISLNKDFISSVIQYEVDVLSNEYASHFELKKEPSSDNWYLDCIKKIQLSNNEDSSAEQKIRLKIRAIETSSETNDIKLTNEKYVNLRILNGDLCMPKFNEQIYEFKVTERNKQLLEPIYVEDCDYGQNGDIYLETTNKNFTFKVKKVYRESKLALEMLNSYIYSQNLTKDGNIIEFDIIARGSNRSLNKFETRSNVRVIINDLNDYSPEFILPEPAYILKNGIPTREQQRIFSYKVPEHQDFTLDVKAIDRDEGSDGRLWYTIGYLKEDNFKIITDLDNINHIFKIKVPGEYLDGKSQEPIIFSVICEDYGEPKLKSDIIIYIRPQSTSFKPIFFEFNKYEFELTENNYNGPFKLKLINDNLKKSKVILKELYDPLNLLTLEYEDLNRITISEEELTSYRDPAFSSISSIDSEIENELSVLLYPLKKDFDKLYLENNKSDIYIYKLRAFVEQKPEINTDLTIYIKLIDTNDNVPKLILTNVKNSYLNATLNSNFKSNSLLKIENNDFSIKFHDEDFSDMYGLRSLYFKLNDTRFAIDYENISNQINSDNHLNSLSVPIKVQALNNQFELHEESIIWLNLTCRDSYFYQLDQKYKNEFLSTFVLIRISLIRDDKLAKLVMPVFNKESYIFTVNESYLGIIGQINTFSKENQAKISPVNLKYKLDFGKNINLANYFKLVNNEIHLIEPFDYESGQTLFNFSILAYSSATSAFLAKAQIIVFVNDTNDEIPIFSKSEYEFNLNKNIIKANSIIGKVYASDLDKEDHDSLEITSQDEKFEIKKSDHISYLLQEYIILVKEEILIDNEEKKIEFKINVKDKLDHASEVNCIIHYVQDQKIEELKWYDVNNDTLETSNYTYEMSRINLNGFVFRIKARFDPELIDTKHKIKYKLVETNVKFSSNPFELNEDTGEIMCKISPVIENEHFVKLNTYYLFAQAYYIIDKDDEKFNKNAVKRSIQLARSQITYWSPVIKIKIKIIDENSVLKPMFVLPSSNNSLILINNHHLDAAHDKLNIYKLLATSPFINTDETKKNDIRYNITEICLTSLDDLNIKKNCSLIQKFPFKIDSTSGSLTLDMKSFNTDDYINLLKANNQDLNSFIFKLKVEANDSSNNITNDNYLNIEFHLNNLKDLFKKSIDTLPRVEYSLETTVQEKENLNNQTEKYLISNEDANQPTISIDDIRHVFDPLSYSENSSSTPLDSETKHNRKAYKKIKEDDIIIIKRINPVYKYVSNNESSDVKLPGTVENFEISLNESLSPNSIIATLKPNIKNIELNNLFTKQLKIKGSNSETDLNSFNPESFVSFDQSTGNIKLIRKLDSELVKNITFSIVNFASDDLLNKNLSLNNNSSKMDTTINKIDIKIIVKDVNDKPPKLVLDNIEKLNGDNLIIVSVNSLNKTSVKSIGKSISSTLPPPRPPPIDIPEMNFTAPKFPPMPVFESREYTQNIKQLNEFSNNNLIKVYKINDPDQFNNFSVKFSNDSSEVILSNFLVETNQTHILLKKKNNYNSSQLLNSGSSRFSIELNDGNRIVNYGGEIFNFDVSQIGHFILYAPINGRYMIEVYKSTLPNVKLDFQPPIQIRNIFPFDIYMTLEGDYAKYFHLSNPKIKPIGLINFLPHDVSISLKEPLENSVDIMYSSLINLQLRLTTNNSYVNQLLQTIGLLKIKVNIKNQNKYEPQIISITPEDGMIELNEGYYNRKPIASIKAFDKDRGDPGRLEYFILGPSMIDIDRANGSIYFTGTLDAESQSEVVFHAFARDLSPAPAGMSSKLQEFRIKVNDINEFKPIIQPSLYLLSINENDDSIVLPYSYIKSLELECYDRDINSTLIMTLNSVRYVYKHESTVYVDDMQPSENNRHIIQDLFKIIFKNDTNNRSTAHLALTKPIDYEKLFKPNETNIRIDILCSDGKFESLSKIIVNVHDLNDNQPLFTQKNLTIRRNESNLLYNLVQVKAIDMDLSSQYGNESLVYAIKKCSPDIYKIYIDKLSGQLSSKLIIDLDTKEIIEKRKQIYKMLYDNETFIDELNDEMKKEIEFMRNFNRVTCEINVHDSLDASVHSLNDSMTLTIEIDDVNDNKPEIDPGQELTYELKEGEGYGYRIAQIRVFDKDDARGLECLFSNGFRVFDSFELVTSLDKIDSYHTAWCSLKVRDSQVVEYDVIKRSTYVLDIDIMDTKPKPPTYPNPGRTSFQVIIKIIPVNNKPPMFLNGEKETFYVIDSVRPGFLISTIAAIDMDNPNPDRIIYKLDSRLSSQYIDKFELRQYKKTTKKYWGSVGLVTKSKLDASESPYILSIIAYDGPPELKDTLFSQKLVSIVVLNKGSMSVWYDSSNGLPVDYYSIDLEENAKPDQVILRVQAKIPDSEHGFDSKSDKLNNVEYIIEPESNMQTNYYYKIDKLTGEISTTNVIVDYEEKDKNKLQLMRNIRIRATSIDNYLSYITHVSVNVIDKNDNEPIFTETNRIFYIVENQTSTEKIPFIGQFYAHDLDSDSYGLVEYRLSDDNPMELSGLFELNKTSGDLYLLRPDLIDREENEKIELIVTCYDNHGNSSNSLNTSTIITIRILDINDNHPQFINVSQIYYDINENELDFELKLDAIDLDYGNNSTLTFSLDRNLNSMEVMQKFTINSMTGLLSLISPLDYETKTNYDVLITCSDNGHPIKLNSTVKLNFQVIDQNDHMPTFALNKFITNINKIYINESINYGDYIVRVEAVDQDPTIQFRNTSYSIDWLSGRYFLNNSQIDFREKKNLFTVDSLTGEIKFGHIERLNFSDINEYIIGLKAIDQDKPDLFYDRFNLTLVLRPSNEKIPVFDLFETDREKEKVLKLYRRGLSESTPNNYMIDIVKAHDPNQHGIKYYLDSVQEMKNNTVISYVLNSDLFNIDQNTGIVKAIGERSKYMADSYKLNVRAVSRLNENLNNTMDLIINIDSTRDSLFDSQIYEIDLEENSEKDLNIFKLTPKSSIGPKNLNLKYEFNEKYSTPTNIYKQWFKLDELNGYISTNTDSIDFEKYNETLLSINIYDSSTLDLIENILLKVNIIDLNDNKPEFDMSYNYKPTIIEDDSSTVNKERFITKFKAIDFDGTYLNSKIEYSIVDTTSLSSSFKLVKLFNSNEEIGLYKLSGVNLDRDDPMISNHIDLVILAQDMAKDELDRLSNEIKLKITLNDLNDNYPVILNNNEKIQLREDHPLNKQFYQIKATDFDEGVNAELAFRVYDEQTLDIQNKTIKTSFISVDKNGYLYLVNNIDYEREKEINVTIAVFDKSINPKTSFASLIIEILNINDNMPTLIDLPNDNSIKDMSTNCLINVNEGPSSKGKFLLQFNASDYDSNDSFEFDLVKVQSVSTITLKHKDLNKNVFKLEKQTGKLYVNNIIELDRELTELYRLIIRLKDKEIFGHRFETLHTCLIRVLDINDNKPQFIDMDKMEFKILPIINELTFIHWFSARDLDMGNNGTIEYSIKYPVSESATPKSANLFKINTNGYLYLNLISENNAKDLNSKHQLNDLYELEIIASDLGLPERLNNSISIKIRIDPNYFKFSQKLNNQLDLKFKSEIVYIEENSPNGTFIDKVSVLNSYNSIFKPISDSKSNKILLEFKLLTCENIFEINKYTGEIYILNSKLLDFEETNEFLIQVEAFEIQTMIDLKQQRFGRTSILVKLNNINDNPPVFNSNQFVYSINENEIKIPTQLSLDLINNNLIILSDLDLYNDNGQYLIKNQINPIDVRLNGSDSTVFRLIKLDNQNSKNFKFALEAIEKLDYEIKSSYEFSIIANDGNFRSSAQITVNVNDLNDNLPQFEYKVYEFDLDENSPISTTIGTIHAKDNDMSPINMIVYYKILNINIKPGVLNENKNVNSKIQLNDLSLFKINEKSGEITVNNNKLLDRELIESFNLTVIAYNYGDYLNMIDRTIVIIYLKDLNDNAPILNYDFVTLNIREKTKVLPRKILDLNGNDYDLNENGTINFRIHSINGIELETDSSESNEIINKNSSHFYIDPFTGQFFLNSYFDLDELKGSKSKSFELVIDAFDLGPIGDKKITKCTIFVNILDVNDHEPKLERPLKKTFEYDEDSNGLIKLNELKYLFDVNCKDPDYSNNKIKYFLEHDLNEDWSYFELDETNGRLYSKYKFDYELKKEYNLKLICKDTSGIMIDLDAKSIYNLANKSSVINDLEHAYPLELFTTNKITIKINDVDDNEPEFGFHNDTILKEVPDNLEIDSIIFVLPIVFDRDSYKSNTKARYIILSGNEQGKFELNETTGELKLIDELDRKEANLYKLVIKATSKITFNPDNLDISSNNDKSIIRIELNVVKDKLFIEFDEQNYFISYQLTNSTIDLTNSSLSIHKQYRLNNDNFEINSLSMLNSNKSSNNLVLRDIKNSAIFYSRAHLKQRKMKKIVKFNIEMVQLIRSNEKVPNKLSLNSLVTVAGNKNEINWSNSNLFIIDENNGKIYLNRLTLLKASNYALGDRFVLSISATPVKNMIDNEMIGDQELIENTMTHLTIRLTEKDYSFIMPLNNININDIIFSYLNPLRVKYIPRILEADGVKISIQDLLSMSTTNIDNKHYLIVQVETKFDHKQVDLDLFINLWKNYSSSNIYLKELNSFIDRQPSQDARVIDPYDQFDSNKPFYTSWLFWLLFIIGILLIIILIFFICCIKLTKKQQKNSKHNGIVIEYPPNINPVYQDGVINLKNKSITSLKRHSQRSKVVRVDLEKTQSLEDKIDFDYEEQELHMNINDEDILEDDQLVTKQI